MGMAEKFDPPPFAKKETVYRHPAADTCICGCGKPYACDTDPHEWKPPPDNHNKETTT